MINIKEDIPKKCSGVSSLHVLFDFNPDIVTALKQMPKYFYDSKTHEWELPCTCLAELLDNLVYFDDITLELLQEDNGGVHYYPKLVDNYKIKPFDHQVQAVEYFLNRDCGLLLDEPGLGKSASIIHLAEELKVQKGLEHCLIICGINSLKGNWESEIKKHSDLSCRIIGKKINSRGKISYASVKERATELYQPLDAFFYIINVEMLRQDDIIQALKTSKNKIDMVVVDECHKCKTSGSAQGHGLLKLTNYAHKIGLTGTLVESSPLNVFVPLKWIGVEKANLTNFKQQYCVYGGFGGHQIIGYKNIPMLKEELETCSLRRTKDIIKDLPPKTIINEIISMDEIHRKFYEDVKEGVKEQCNKITLNIDNTLALTTRLMQATACPSILTTTNVSSSKVLRAAELAEEIIENGHKVVVMSTFKEPLNVLNTLLQNYCPLLLTGDVPPDIFDQNVKSFQENPKYKVALCTVSKAGTGLTLNAAEYMICINTPWNYSQASQAFDRIHRVDNQKPVFIYNLICEDTIDEHVEAILQRKKAMAAYMLEDNLNDTDVKLLREYLQNF